MSNCEDKEDKEMEGINKNSPFRNFAFFDGIYYTPLAFDSKRVLAVKNIKEHNGFKYEVVGVFDVDELPKDVQDLIPILQKTVDKIRYNKRLTNIKRKKMREIKKKIESEIDKLSENL